MTDQTDTETSPLRLLALVAIGVIGGFTAAAWWPRPWKKAD